MTAPARTYGALALREGRWVIDRLEPHVRIKLKAIFPKVPKANPPPYVFPAEPATAAELTWFESGFPLAMTAEDRAALLAGKAAHEARAAQAELLLGDSYTPTPGRGWRPGCAPRAHQQAAAEVCRLFGGVLVGDDVGEGKSFTVMAACMLPGALPAVVVCDRNLQAQWAAYFRDNTTLTTHKVRQASPYTLPPADVRIFAWSQLLGWADQWELMTVGLAAFDEAQELRTGRDSQRGVSAYEMVQRARYRMAATATPIYGYGREIWQVMRFIRPEVLGDAADFMREWAPNGGVKDPKALGAYLRDQHAFVRKRKAVNRVNSLVIPVEHDAAELASIEDIARSLARTAATGAFHEAGKATRDLDLRVRHATGVAKAKAVAARVRILVEAGEPLILAGWHRAVYDIWNAELSDLAPAMYTGTESPAEKTRQVNRFLSGETDILIMSLRSARGLDGLQQRCRRVAVGELDWSPQVHQQLIGRVDREGSIVDGIDPDDGGMIDAFYFVTDDGSDPPMMGVLGLKASESNGIVDPDLGLRQARRDTDGLKALVNRYLDGRRAADSRPVQGAGLHPVAVRGAEATVSA